MYLMQDLQQSKCLDHSKQDPPKYLCLKQDKLLLIDPSEIGIIEKKDGENHNFESSIRKKKDGGVPQLHIIEWAHINISSIPDKDF